MRRSIEGLGLVPPGIVVEHQNVGTDHIVVSGRLASVEAGCPDCGTLSRSCHSRYVRTLADLPVGGRTMAILLTVRRFRCTTPGCRRTTFSEDVGGQIGRRHGRRSARCDQVVHAVGIALGGRPGSRMMARLATPCSRDTLLRSIRRTAGRLSANTGDAPRVIGIDDFAWRRGHRYGSIVVDLERRAVIDILPDRERETVATWFRANRQVEVICRDRGASYSAAANSAAPQAVQVADRWHLFENASEAFLQAVRAELPRLRKALAPKAVIDPATLTRAERLQWEGALARTTINEQVEALASAGTPIKQIARTTGVARQTVRRILRGVRHEVFRSRQSSLDPWQLRLEAEWDAGCRNGSELWRRLRAAGFVGGLRVVTEWATKRRRDEKTGQPAGASVSARSIARDMTSERSSGSARVAMVNAIVETASPALVEARSLMDQFHAMMRTREPEKLAPWIAAAKESNIAAFAAGIATDQAAVRAAIVEPWSSGQVEGQVTRLKLVKRQMYGRANLDLLKARLMAA